MKRTLREVKDPLSRAKRVRMLYKKNSGVFKDKEKLTEFKEPIVMLKRRSGTVEFLEDASKGRMEITHSDGKPRTIYLDPAFLLTFDYGKKKFKGYWCDEDHPLPLPLDPIITTETINQIVEKISLDMNKMNTPKGMNPKTIKMLIWFALGAGLLLILWQTHIFEMLVGMITGHPYVAPQVANTVTTTGTNAAAELTKNALGVNAGG